MKAACLLVLALVGRVRAEEIPLKDIWAEGIPGTRNVRDLQYVPEPRSRAARQLSLVEQFKSPLRRGLPPDAAGKGFAVSGTGLAALQAASDVMTGKSKRPAKLPADQDITVVIYSHLFGASFRLDSVDQGGKVITVKWHFETHSAPMSTAHFALIPLGKLAPGKYEVSMVELPLRTGDRGARSEPIPKKQIRSVVCQSFQFTVK
jgi:hypothetical protein